MSFFDFSKTPSRRLSVLVTEMEESAWLRVILIPLEEISLHSQLDFSWRESSEIPFRFMSTTLDTIAGQLITRLLERSCTILFPRLSILSENVPGEEFSHCFTEIVSHSSRQILPKFSFKTSTALRSLDKLSLTLASPIIQQVKVLPSRTRSQLMVTGRMCASTTLPSATLVATRESIPNLGDSILPVLLLVPSMKNSRQWLLVISFEMYSCMIALYSSRYFFWFRLMKNAPDFRSRMCTTAMFRKSSAAAMCGHLMPFPKKTQLMMRKSMQLRCVGMMMRGPCVSSLCAWILERAALSTTTRSQMVPNTLWRNQANMRSDPIEQSLNICVHISSAAFVSSSSAFSQETAGPSILSICSSTSSLIASLTDLLLRTNCTASLLGSPRAALPSRSAHMMSEKQWALSVLRRSRFSGLNCSTWWLRRCFLMLQTQRRTQVRQLMALMLKSRSRWSRGESWLSRSIDLMLSHSHSCVRKYLYLFISRIFCCVSCCARLPSIFQDTISSKLPTLFFTSEGSSSLACFARLASLLSVTVTLGDLTPYSCQASWQQVIHCWRVTQLRVLVERLRVSALRAVVRAARRRRRLATWSLGTMSTLLRRLPSTLRMSPVPIWQTRQVKQLKRVVQPSKLAMVGPREGTRRMRMVWATRAQLFSMKSMLHRQPSTAVVKLSLRQWAASSRCVNLCLNCATSSSSSSDTYPGSRPYMLDRWTTRLTSIFSSSSAILVVLIRWQSITFSMPEKSIGSNSENSTSTAFLYVWLTNS